MRSCSPVSSLVLISTLRSIDSQLLYYAPVLRFGAFALPFAGGTLVVSVVAGQWANRIWPRSAPTGRFKNTPYECGMLPIGEGNTRLSVKFYLVAMLFILFDIEVVFMYPWAVIYRQMLETNANLIFGAMLSFLGVLFVGYIYALKKKAFDWKT